MKLAAFFPIAGVKPGSGQCAPQNPLGEEAKVIRDWNITQAGRNKFFLMRTIRQGTGHIYFCNKSDVGKKYSHVL